MIIEGKTIKIAITATIAAGVVKIDAICLPEKSLKTEIFKMSTWNFLSKNTGLPDLKL